MSALLKTWLPRREQNVFLLSTKSILHCNNASFDYYQAMLPTAENGHQNVVRN